MRALPLAALCLPGLLACGPVGEYTPNQLPTAVAGADRSAEIDELLTFDGSASSDPDGSLTAWSWNFGDGSSAEGEVVEHAFSAAQSYVVSLTVTDDRGGSARDELVVSVGGSSLRAQMSASPSTAHVHEAVRFDGSASSPAGAITAYTWSFGDGASASGAVVHHAYTNPGQFRVRLTVQDGSGASASVEGFVEVRAASVAGVYDLTATPASYACAEYSVSFADTELTLDDSGAGLGATSTAGHSFSGSLSGQDFSLSGSSSQSTGGSCGSAQVTTTLQGRFDGPGHFTGTASLYFDLTIPCQCSAMFSIEGTRR